MARKSLLLSLAFDKRTIVPDGYGNEEEDFQLQFRSYASIEYRRGGEGVLGARLEAQQPAVITVRVNSNTDLIRPDWQARLTDRVFELTEMPTKTQDRGYYEILAIARPADG